MAKSIAQKLRIEAGNSLLTIHAPKEFITELQGLPEKVTISSSLKKFEQIHWFVADSGILKKDVLKVLNLLGDGIICWVYYPKGSSGMQTDLTRDKGWDALMQHDFIQWITLISFNTTWSVFGIRRKTEMDEKKAASAKQREIFNWIDPATKSVLIPDELKTAFKQHKKALQFFEALSFTNKKEYVEWIVTAKKTETKIDRINGTIERLEKGWKNPRNL